MLAVAPVGPGEALLEQALRLHVEVTVWTREETALSK